MVKTPEEMLEPPKKPDLAVVSVLEKAIDEWLELQPKNQKQYIYSFETLESAENMSELASRYQSAGWIVNFSSIVTDVGPFSTFALNRRPYRSLDMFYPFLTKELSK